MSKHAATPAPCPCGNARPYARCCAPFIEGGAVSPDAESLMRSRYAAYARLASAYLLATWHPSTRPVDIGFDAPLPQWIGLDIKARGQTDADHAWVEFVARYKVGGRAYRLHEISRFVREDGRWFYLDGDTGAPG